VESEVWKNTADVLASLRTTNGIWLSPAGSVRRSRAMYTPDTAVDGTAQDADTAQLPQSSVSVVGAQPQFGWVCGNGTDGEMVCCNRAPSPLYQPRR